MSDLVNHPSHYSKTGRKECWDEMIEHFGKEAVIIFDVLNAYKYHYRAGSKSGNFEKPDLEKMLNYIRHAENLLRDEDIYLAKHVFEKLQEILYEEKNADKIQLSTLKAGDVFKIGEYDFIVLEQMNSQATVISKDFMMENVVFDKDTRDYNKSNIKRMIEEKIQPKIESEIGADNLVEHEVDLTSVDKQNEFENCRCKVRPVTFDEARLYNNLLVNKELGDWWWTCTPWSTENRGWEYSISVVSPGGSFGGNYCYSSLDVRLFCILKSDIFVSRGEN